MGGLKKPPMNSALLEYPGPTGAHFNPLCSGFILHRALKMCPGHFYFLPNPIFFNHPFVLADLGNEYVDVLKNLKHEVALFEIKITRPVIKIVNSSGWAHAGSSKLLIRISIKRFQVRYAGH